MQKETFIISMGGSLIVPDEIDTKFLRSFVQLILKHSKRKRFAIITGGGRTSRKYQNAAKEIMNISDTDLDWIGIHSTRLNAQLVHALFKGNAEAKIVKNPNEKLSMRKNIVIAAGWKPGFSTDFDSVLLAKNLHSKKVINLTNIDYVCDKDPKYFKDAKPIKEIIWKDFRKLLPKKWSPGINYPFDPVASKEAEKLGIEVAIVNGRNIENLERCIEEKEFVGTRIKT